MPLYTAGTAAFTSGSRAVVGTGTEWGSEINPGTVLQANGTYMEVFSIEDDTHLTLVDEAPATYSGAYTALVSVDNASHLFLMNKIEEFLSDRETSLTQFTDWMTGTSTGGPDGDGKYPLTDRYGNTTLVPSVPTLSADAQALSTAVGQLGDFSTAVQAAQSAASAAHDSAVAAANSASSVGDASGSASAAADSASAAHTSETNAGQSATEAENSATAAATSETNAKTSETNAKASETNAKTSETNAKTSETNAKASETAAASSETNASSSATAAAASKSHAATSETNAATSATAAANSASDAQTAANTCTSISSTLGTSVSDAQAAAEAAASQASGSATAASGYASDAASSAVTAGNNSASAALSATLAQKWAEQDDGTTVDGTGYSAKYWAGRAQAATNVTAEGVPVTEISGYSGDNVQDVLASLGSALSGDVSNMAKVLAWAVGTVDGGPNGDGTYPLPSGGTTVNVKCPAQIINDAGSGGGGTSEVTTLDPVMKTAAVTLDATKLQATFAGGSQAVILGTTQKSTGKLYFEIKFVSGTSSGNAAVGVCARNEGLDRQVGYDDSGNSAGVFQGSGKIYAGGVTSVTSSGFSTANDVVSVAVDIDNRLVWSRTNGGAWSGDPVAGTGGVTISGTLPLVACICTDEAAVFSANFGTDGALAYAPPSGFVGWGV